MAGCIALIWTASGEGFSASSTSRFLGPLLRWLFGEVDPATVKSLHHALRKAAHVVEYGLLALLCYRALRMTIRTTLVRHALVALILVAAVAASDEARQSRLAARTGSAADVALDLAGGLAGLALAGWLCHRPRLERWFPEAPPGSRG